MLLAVKDRVYEYWVIIPVSRPQTGVRMSHQRPKTLKKMSSPNPCAQRREQHQKSAKYE
jgi:hypothetical protein